MCKRLNWAQDQGSCRMGGKTLWSYQMVRSKIGWKLRKMKAAYGDRTIVCRRLVFQVMLMNAPSYAVGLEAGIGQAYFELPWLLYRPH
jgi:hypothetical protein